MKYLSWRSIKDNSSQSIHNKKLGNYTFLTVRFLWDMTPMFCKLEN